MTSLRVILDPVLGPPSAVSHYARRLVRSLIAAAPEGSTVSGVLSAAPEDEIEAVTGSLPGLAEVHRMRLGPREVRAAWQHGITLIPGRGLLHAADGHAPLSRHDRVSAPDTQVVVTIHDSLPWTDPESLEPRAAARRRAMGRRAERYADAIVVPSRAIADRLAEHLDVSERLRVVAAAPRPSTAISADADPASPYVLAVLPDDDMRSIGRLGRIASALPHPFRLMVVGPDAGEHGPEADRSPLPFPRTDEALGRLISGATALIAVSTEMGFGLSALDAMRLGTPIVHTSSDDAREMLAGAGLELSADADADEVVDAVRAIASDDLLRQRLATLGRDRAGAFTWRDTSEKIWQLHADL